VIPTPSREALWGATAADAAFTKRADDTDMRLDDRRRESLDIISFERYALESGG
jgi:hypothetical protein